MPLLFLRLSCLSLIMPARSLARILGKYFAHEFHEFLCNSWAIIFRGISVAPKTTSSCLKLSPLSSYKNNPILALVQISATDPVAIPVAHSLRVNSCNSWTKKHPVIQKFFRPLYAFLPPPDFLTTAYLAPNASNLSLHASFIFAPPCLPFVHFVLRNGQKQYFILIFALINSINHKTGPL